MRNHGSLAELRETLSRLLGKLEEPVSSHAARVPARASRARIRRRAPGGGAVLRWRCSEWAWCAGIGRARRRRARAITLPLRHDDIIRQQAADKHLDASLIAAVIYEESRFRDQTSHAGARGLMQITPDTADFIAKNSGGYRFEQEDLATPQINISYGAFYLRYLLDHYDGHEAPAIAAYNAGLTNADRWVADAGGAGEFDPASDIPFPRRAPTWATCSSAAASTATTTAASSACSQLGDLPAAALDRGVAARIADHGPQLAPAGGLG